MHFNFFGILKLFRSIASAHRFASDGPQISLQPHHLLPPSNPKPPPCAPLFVPRQPIHCIPRPIHLVSKANGGREGEERGGGQRKKKGAARGAADEEVASSPRHLLPFRSKHTMGSQPMGKGEDKGMMCSFSSCCSHLIRPSH